jgi:hypothetical protein
MLAHFQPTGESEQDNPGRQNLTVPFLQRPLRLIAVPDRAMEPELCPGQLAYVQNFEVRGLNYLEQRMAVRVEGRPESDSRESGISGRVLVRRIQAIGAKIHLFGNRDGYDETFIRPDGWEPPSNWKISGRIHPNLVALGPIVATSRGGQTYIATAGWSN